MTGPLIDPELLEHCAQAAYEADRAPGREWARETGHTRQLYRTIARAVLVEALRPAPTPGPLDGQQPLPEEP